MTAVFFSAIVTLVVCAAIFSCFSAVVGYLYIADRRRARARAAVARDVAEERRQRRRARFPEALPGPQDLHEEPPVLGNVLIKDEHTLAMLQCDLVAIAVPASVLHTTPVTTFTSTTANSTAAACSSGHEDDFVEVLDTSEMVVEGGRSVTAPATTTNRRAIYASADGAAASPRAAQRSFHDSLLDGGYVIVECAVPASLSVSGASRSEASPLSSVGPRDEDEQVDEEEQEKAATAAPAKTSITQYFRFQRSSSPYGTSQYLTHK